MSRPYSFIWQLRTLNGAAMNFGFGVPTRRPLATPGDISTIAAKGEDLEFGTVVVNDHIVVPRDVESRYPYSQSGQWAGGCIGEALELLASSFNREKDQKQTFYVKFPGDPNG
jgi:hypothetical protein